MLRSIQRYEAEILEHRPRTLSIAVDGKILASHDVQAQKNVLSARIERPENTSFVEVFSEQGRVMPRLRTRRNLHAKRTSFSVKPRA